MFSTCVVNERHVMVSARCIDLIPRGISDTSISIGTTSVVIVDSRGQEQLGGGVVHI